MPEAPSTSHIRRILDVVLEVAEPISGGDVRTHVGPAGFADTERRYSDDARGSSIRLPVSPVGRDEQGRIIRPLSPPATPPPSGRRS